MSAYNHDRDTGKETNKRIHYLCEISYKTRVFFYSISVKIYMVFLAMFYWILFELLLTHLLHLFANLTVGFKEFSNTIINASLILLR